MSRVSYVMLNPGSVKELTRAVRGCLAKLTAELCRDAEVERTDVLEVTVVGNPVMHHLLLGIDPTELGGAPFALAVDDALRIRASELGLPVNAGARVYVLPCIAGHVGADTAGVILAEAPHLADDVTLVVDVGTNAEIVLGNRERLLAASSPTGPAFEGAQISCGQRAAPGAIERVRIDTETLEPRVKVVGCDSWSDEPGFAGTRVTGVCGSGIVEVVAELLLAGILTTDGTIDGSLGARSPRIVPDGRTFSYVLWPGEPELRITQNDIRQIQLAKAALHAGCRLLMERYGIDRVDRVRLAGAFGAHIDPVHALVLGLVPDCDPAQRDVGGQCSGHRRPDRAAEPRRARRDRARRARRGEGRDRGRAALPGALRPRDGDPARRRTRTSDWRGASRSPPGGQHRPRGVRGAVPQRQGGRPHDRDTKKERWPRRTAGGAHARPRRARPVPHPRARALRGAVRGGSRDARGERRADPLRGRGRVPRRARRARALCRCGRGCAGRTRAVPARALPLPRPGDRSVAVHAGGAQPGERRRLRRAGDDLRAGVRLAVRPRPRRRPPLRHDRGLPELREARLRLAVAPPLGRHRLRAGRRAGQQASLRHGLRAPALLGQAVHGLGHAARARPRHGRDGADRLRPRRRRRAHRRLQPDQRQLAARVGRDDARRARRRTPRRTRP